MKILGIETAVDETAAAVVEDGFKVCSSVVSSQTAIHQKFGGVVPELAARTHLAKIIPTLDQALKRAGVSLEKIDVIAVSTTPGFLISLLVGIEVAKTLGYVFQKPIVALNDLESHAFANWLESPGLFQKIQDYLAWPMLYLIVSGGTTALFKADYFGHFNLLGETKDDACGEAFDKVAKMLGLPYPGGPIISKMANYGRADAFKFPRPLIRVKGCDFSFSGLKTAVFYEIQKLQREKNNLDDQTISDISASFQEAAIESVVFKTVQAAKDYKVKSIAIGGGVAANSRLRELLLQQSLVPVFFPKFVYCTDNAAMLAGCAYYYAQRKIFTHWSKVEPFVYKNGKGRICRL